MQDPFLRRIAAGLQQRTAEEAEAITLLFPTRRAVVYFRKYYAALAGRPVWPPTAFALRNYIQHLSRYFIADHNLLVIKLFEAFNDLGLAGGLTQFARLDQFFPLGEMILADFNTIDSYLVPPEKIFSNLTALKEVDNQFGGLEEDEKHFISRFWQHIHAENSDEQKLFLEVWETLPELHEAFNARLRQHEMAYEGMIFKLLIKRAQAGETFVPHGQRIIAAGFNALNKAQETLFGHLAKAGKLGFIWDGDVFYQRYEHQEAGLFLRKNLARFKNFPSRTYFTDNFRSPRPVHVWQAPGRTALAKSITQQLQGLGQEELKQTAIVLADEHLLVPVLSALPPQVESLNISMGYPIRETPLYSLILSYLRLHTQAQRHKPKDRPYYFRDAHALARHLFVRQLDPELAEKLQEQIGSGQLMYLSAAEMAKHANNTAEIFLKPVADGTQVLEQLMQGMHTLFEYFEDKHGPAEGDVALHADSIHKEVVYHTYKYFQQLSGQLSGGPHGISLPLIERLIRRYLQTLSIPFEADYTDQLQVVGLMETRNLDFKRVLLVGASEGIIPSTSRGATLIPESLRHGYGLPVLAQQDAIYAYVFYRLLQRAEDVHIYYNSKADEQQSGEVSRYVRQLQYESELDVQYHHLGLRTKTSPDLPILIPWHVRAKNSLWRYTLRNKAGKQAISASALGTYLECPLRYYFRYIAGIKEREEMEEEMSEARFGSILHEAMRILYGEKNPRQGQDMEAQDFEGLKAQADEALAQAYRQEMGLKPGRPLELQGNALIVYRMLLQYVYRIITFDKQQAPLTIRYLEEDHFTATLPLAEGAEGEHVRLQAKIDRIDTQDGVLRIIDYKTGNGNLAVLPDKLFARSAYYRNNQRYVFQILFYSYVYHKQNPHVQHLTPAIYLLRQLNRNNYQPVITMANSIIEDKQLFPLLDDFEAQLQSVLSEIYNPGTGFDQTEDPNACVYCPYRTICNR